jgi:hypothetical protein
MDLETVLAIAHDHYEEITALSAIALVGATFVLVIGANQNAKREMRAYMGFKNGSIRHVAVGQKPVLEIFFSNFGKTPAYGLRYWVEAGVMNRSTRAFKRARFGTSRRVIDPGNTLRIWSTLDEPLTQEQFDGAETGDRPIFFWGRVHYRDAFGYWRRTDFRVQHGESVMGTDRMIFSSKGNTAT